MKDFAERNTAYLQSIRKNLAEHFPEIDRLERLSALEGLTLVEECRVADILSLTYEARAPSLLPHVRKSLIDNNVTKPHNIRATFTLREGTPAETRYVRMGFYGGRLAITLGVKV